MPPPSRLLSPPFFFFHDTATTEIYTLSLHDALPIFWTGTQRPFAVRDELADVFRVPVSRDRKSTRLNSSHVKNSYAGCCLKKKKLRRARAQAHVGGLYLQSLSLCACGH